MNGDLTPEIAAAVATERWADVMHVNLDGYSSLELVQEAARVLAAEIERLKAELAENEAAEGGHRGRPPMSDLRDAIEERLASTHWSWWFDKERHVPIYDGVPQERALADAVIAMPEIVDMFALKRLVGDLTVEQGVTWPLWMPESRRQRRKRLKGKR